MDHTDNKPTILSVLAHPDDESFGMGGTLALYSRRGAEVHLICATHGEAGEVDDEFLQNYASKAELRVAELRCAAQKLGLSDLHLLGYRDSGMLGSPNNQHPQALINAPVDVVAQKVVEIAKKLKPQVMITFDPRGGYCHPDHVAIHKATVRAFEILQQSEDGYKPQKLYYHNFPRGFVRMLARIMRLFGKDPSRFGKNGDIDLVAISEAYFPTHAVIRYRQFSGMKNQAAACHRSQGGHKMNRGITGWFATLFARDQYMRAYPPATERTKETDLFTGLDVQWQG